MKSRLHLVTSVLQSTGLQSTAGWRRRSSSTRTRFGFLPGLSFARTLLAVRSWPRAFPHLFNYLVNALPRKVELVRNKTKRFSSSMQIQNSRVSVGIRRRPWSKRSPLPVANLLEPLDAVAAQLSLAVPLAKITNPGAERQRFTINVFDVSGRDPAMSLAREELIECCNCEIETRDVVHVEDNSKRV